MGLFTLSQQQSLHKQNQNIIFVDTNIFPNYDCITLYLSLISKNIIDYFIEQNYHKIRFIGGRDMESIPDEREIQFIEYTTLKNIFDPNFFYIGKFTNSFGHDIAKQMLQLMPLKIIRDIAISSAKRILENEKNLQVHCHKFQHLN